MVDRIDKREKATTGKGRRVVARYPYSLGFYPIDGLHTKEVKGYKPSLALL